MDSLKNEMPEVSIICTAYNQEKVISKCLDGFINQKTDFKYDIIIHDDCSTDGTLDVILSYENKYPDLFVVITEEENQFFIHRLTEEEVFLDWKVHTSSYFFRKECYRVRDEYAYWCRFFSDYIRLCNAKDLGEVYCLPELMSVYNFNNPDGVTNVYNDGFQKKLDQIEGLIEFLKEFDTFTDHRHSEVILKRLNYQIEEMNRIMAKMQESGSNK